MPGLVPILVNGILKNVSKIFYRKQNWHSERSNHTVKIEKMWKLNSGWVFFFFSSLLFL